MTKAPLTEFQVVAPTLLEYVAVRSLVRGTATHLGGISLRRDPRLPESAAVVVCGLAGSLTAAVPSGSVVIPERLALMDGRSFACDPLLVSLLTDGAFRLGFKPVRGNMLTASGLVTGAERMQWAARGFLAVDMEAGLFAGRCARLATVRVALDSPDHPISADWLRPGRAMRRLELWRELGWLAWAAPAYAWKAARVLNAALTSSRAGE
jgi:hypothetical protein